jgi:hypothetical protein
MRELSIFLTRSQTDDVDAQIVSKSRVPEEVTARFVQYIPPFYGACRVLPSSSRSICAFSSYTLVFIGPLDLQSREPGVQVGQGAAGNSSVVTSVFLTRHTTTRRLVDYGVFRSGHLAKGGNTPESLWFLKLKELLEVKQLERQKV